MSNENGNGIVEVEEVRALAHHTPVELAEIESQIATAKRYPRDIARAKDKMMAMANLDQETAESCYYALPRDGKTIDGPSVRLAEIALTAYGNCVAEADVIDEDDRFVYAMGQCRDLENNVAVRVKVRRRITYKNGNRYNDDMIAVTANAACAIALRNAIFKVIPGAYIKPVFERVKQTAVGKSQSLANRRAEVIKRLMKFGVAEPRILAAIGRQSQDEVTFDDVAKLIGLGTALRDGETTVEQAFPVSFDEMQQANESRIRQQAGSRDVKMNPEWEAKKQAALKKLQEAQAEAEQFTSDKPEAAENEQACDEEMPEFMRDDV